MTRDAVRVGDGRVDQTASSAAESISATAAAQAADENFPVALRVLPGRYRRHLSAVYNFARTVDDMGDRAPVPQRLALLDELEADLGRLYRALPAARPGPGAAGAGGQEGQGQERQGQVGQGQAGQGGPVTADRAGTRPGAGGDDVPRLAVIRALAPTVAECAIPAQLLCDLIEANRRDQVVTRYQSFDDLVGYCRLSANPIGRLVLRIFGAATPEREVLSDHVCTALQIAEHLQDVAEDLRAGRIYLPARDMDRFGCSERDLAAQAASPQVRALIAFQVRRARGLLDEGAPIVGGLRGAARVAVAGYVAGGRAALAAITASGHDVLRATPRPGTRRLAAQMLRTYATGR